MAEEKKSVDEEWKKQVQKEKEKEKEEEQGPSLPEPSFALFVSSLATQTLIALGEIENPITRKKEKNLPQARFTIDTLQLLEEKTRGNLTPEEKRYLDGLLYDLRMSYIDSSK